MVVKWIVSYDNSEAEFSSESEAMRFAKTLIGKFRKVAVWQATLKNYWC